MLCTRHIVAALDTNMLAMRFSEAVLIWSNSHSCNCIAGIYITKMFTM